MSSITETDVLIIGAGIVGASLARELSRYKLKVMVVEKEMDVSFGASKANSGVVHSGIQEENGTLKLKLCKRGNESYPILAEELDIHYKRNGALLVAKNIEELKKLDKERERGAVNGIPGLTMLNKEELLSLEPNLSNELVGGLLIPGGGIVAPYDMVIALIENAVKNGVLLSLSTEVTGISFDKNDFVVTSTRGLIKSRYIINATGLSSAKVARMLGDESFNIYPRRGQEYLLDRKLEGLVNRTIFPMPTQVFGKTFKGVLVIPTVAGNIMIGPTYDPDSDLQTNIEGWEMIYSHARKLVPSIKKEYLITSFAGLRAGSDGEDFCIIPSIKSPKFINAGGVDSPGLTAAPAIAEFIIELLKDAGLKLKLKSDFNPIRRVVRFRDLSLKEKNKLIQKDPAYGNIICRCEQVSEAEVRDAIRRGATTVDGVKFRTRCGMGRCQGGFCTPNIIKLLQEELSLAPEKIVKKTHNSPLLVGVLREKEEGYNERDFD